MSIDAALKVGIGLLGVSATSLGGYKLHGYFTATLEGEFSLIPEGENKWDQLVTKYEKASEEGNPKKMESFDIGSGNDKKSKLINHCKSILKTSLRESESVLEKRRTEIKDWCIPEATALTK